MDDGKAICSELIDDDLSRSWSLWKRPAQIDFSENTIFFALTIDRLAVLTERP